MTTFSTDTQTAHENADRPDFLAVLGLMLPCTEEDVKQAYLAKAKIAHPDAGGDVAQFVALQSAFERALEYSRFHAGHRRWLASSMDRYVEQAAVINQIQQLGGKVEVEGIDWLEREVGLDFAQVME